MFLNKNHKIHVRVVLQARTVRVFAQEEAEVERFDGLLAATYRLANRAAWLQGVTDGGFRRKALNPGSWDDTDTEIPTAWYTRQMVSLIQCVPEDEVEGWYRFCIWILFGLQCWPH